MLHNILAPDIQDNKCNPNHKNCIMVTNVDLTAETAQNILPGARWAVTMSFAGKVRLCNLCKANGLNAVNTPFCAPTWTPILSPSLAPTTLGKHFNWIRLMSDFPEILQAAPWAPLSVQCRYLLTHLFHPLPAWGNVIDCAQSVLLLSGDSSYL